jgi:hypothetical protein
MTLADPFAGIQVHPSRRILSKHQIGTAAAEVAAERAVADASILPIADNSIDGGPVISRQCKQRSDVRIGGRAEYANPLQRRQSCDRCSARKSEPTFGPLDPVQVLFSFGVRESSESRVGLCDRRDRDRTKSQNSKVK